MNVKNQLVEGKKNLVRGGNIYGKKTAFHEAKNAKSAAAKCEPFFDRAPVCPNRVSIWHYRIGDQGGIRCGSGGRTAVGVWVFGNFSGGLVF